jgi:hypothetical protein
MRSRRLVTLSSIALTLGGGAGLAADAGARGQIPCGPSTARTLAGDSRARVYASHGAAFGCAADGSKSYRLGVRTNCIGADLVGPFVVAGEISAYASERCGVDTGFTQVLVRNLRTGKRVSASPAATPPGPESFASVSALVARSDGAAAWVASATSIGNHGANVELRRVEGGGPSALLDSGSAIAPRSLRLRGTTLSWLHGGQRRSASLS